MLILKGTSVFAGLAFGKIAFLKQPEIRVKQTLIDDPEAEVARYEKAKATAITELRALYEKTYAELGAFSAAIIEVQEIMLNDEDYNDSIKSIITEQKTNAEHAVAETSVIFSKMFTEIDNDYMRERAVDVKDISGRIIHILTGAAEPATTFEQPVILAAADLAPSETAQLNKEKTLAFITAGGSTNSHTAILARIMGIPAIVGIGEALSEGLNGKEAIVDGLTGTIYIEPDEKTAMEMKKKAEADACEKTLLLQLKGKENKTLDGKMIDIFANISNVSDADIALKYDAGGVGLFRSEFLYLQAERYPTEDEQFNAYKAVAEAMAGKKVVIRTLDIGADKQVDYFNLPQEENPALGYRGIRICLDRPEIFKTQLRALYRASDFGKIAIMFPMIMSVEEVVEIKKIIKAVKTELDTEGISYSADVEIGIMVETPAAAMISDLLAKEVDFFSIGTNDLTQYTLAIDRQNFKLEKFYRPYHPAVLRMIKMVANNARQEGKRVGICGELGADLTLTETFLKMGIDELSVSPPYILPLRDKVRNTDSSKKD